MAQVTTFSRRSTQYHTNIQKHEGCVKITQSVKQMRLCAPASLPLSSAALTQLHKRTCVDCCGKRQLRDGCCILTGQRTVQWSRQEAASARGQQLTKLCNDWLQGRSRGFHAFLSSTKVDSIFRHGLDGHPGTVWNEIFLRQDPVRHCWHMQISLQ